MGNPVGPPYGGDESHQQQANGVIEEAERRIAAASVVGARGLGQGRSGRHY